MENRVKKIGVLTSGGDAPGMNAAIRAVARTAINRGIEVVGIFRGFNGLINNDMFPMEMRSVSNIINRGGTILYTARSEEFKTEEGMAKAVQICVNEQIEGIIVIGGDGSFRGARDLSVRGIPCIGIPGTIDNDIACSDYTIGYDTAMNTAIEAVDKLRDTSQSHDRCSVVEVMGRRAGYIALNVGIAVGATAIMVPERECDFERDIVKRIKDLHALGKQHFIIIVAEGAGGANDVAKRIEAATGIESRGTILGHTQRGGSPSLRDRVTASTMGHRAVELLSQGLGNRVLAERNSEIVDLDILEALQMHKDISDDLLLTANEISF